MLGFFKKMALKEVLNRAIYLHSKGESVRHITKRFWAEPKVSQGLIALGITDAELVDMIEKEIKKKEVK